MKKICFGRLRRVMWVLSAVIALQQSVSAAFADQYFENTRMDHTVPANCREMDLQNFNSLSRFLTYSIQGGRAAGFTHEYPITRREAESLWATLRAMAHHANSRVPADIGTLFAIGQQMGFDFENEGEVLELLALLQLKQEYPERDYFFTGGVAYGEMGVANMGELDIIVARRSDCGVVAVGEAKLGINQRPHALQQLKRFHQFLQFKLCAHGEKASVCSLR
jgi:hypothetical protein